MHTATSCALSLLLLAALGCGGGGSSGDPPDAGYDCSQEERKDIYSAGMSKAGESGYEVVLVDSIPAPPDKGDNDWTIEVLDPTGASMEAAELQIIPWMPDHGHGTPIVAEVEPPAAGGTEYQVGPVNLWMPGLWRVRVLLEEDGSELDQIDFFFCING